MIGQGHELATKRTTTSVSYRKLLHLLVFEAGEEDQMPYAERLVRSDESQRIGAIMSMVNSAMH